MNKIAIIAGISGFIVGGTCGYFAYSILNKKKIDQAISDGVQKALEEIKTNQRQKIMENEQKKSNIINAIPHFNAVDITKEIISDNGYSQKEETVQEPEGAPDDEESDLPFDAERDAEILKMAEEKHNIWDEKDPDEKELTQEDYDNEQEPDLGVEFEEIDPTKPPYMITEDKYEHDFTEGVDCWDKIEWVLFKDNVLAERVRANEYTTLSSIEVETAIGKGNFKDILNSRDIKRWFVRNNRLKADYLIAKSDRSYSSVIGEDEEE